MITRLPARITACLVLGAAFLFAALTHPDAAFANMGYFGPGMQLNNPDDTSLWQAILLPFLFAAPITIVSIIGLRRMAGAPPVSETTHDDGEELPLAVAAEAASAAIPLDALLGMYLVLLTAVGVWDWRNEGASVAAAFSDATGYLSVSLLMPLAVTVAAELAVAVLVGLRGRSLLAVALVSGVTNPLMNAIVTVTYGLAIGHKYIGLNKMYDVPMYAPDTTWYVILGIAEVLVVVVEWRLLVWLLSPRFTSLRLLVLTITMNAASAILGLILVQSMLVLLLGMMASFFVPLIALGVAVQVIISLNRRRIARRNAAASSS